MADLLLVVLAGAPVPAARGQSAVDPSARPPTAAAPPAVADLARRADAARDAGRLEEASDLYREALRKEPRWAAGLWSLGAIAYEHDRFAECRDTLARLTALHAEAGPAWAIRGLCEFRLSSFAAARRSIDRALREGGLDDPNLLRVVLYHQALLRIRAAEFETAIPPLTQLVSGRPATPDAVMACGLLLLRRAQVPADVAAADEPLVRGAGEAYCAYLARRGDDARARYEALIAAHPAQEHLHYGYGLLLAQQGALEAAEQFRREIEQHPGHVLAHLELAFELLKRGDASAAVAPARAAVRLAPGLFAAHLALGRALVDTGELTRGIAELEEAARLGPGVRETQWALAGAYTRAGRKADAERARSEFRRLESLRRAADPAPASRREAP